MNPLTERTVWHVPYERNVFFTGREEALAELHEQLNKANIAAITQLQSVTGLGALARRKLSSSMFIVTAPNTTLSCGYVLIPKVCLSQNLLHRQAYWNYRNSMNRSIIW